jgi:tRNA(Ile)-lysidine synthase
MADRVELQFRRAIADLVPDGSAVVAAVSGGGDSVALLHLMHRASRSRGYRLVVAHLDHGLRRGSRGDRRFVEELAQQLSVECVADRREVPRLRRRDESPEEAARRVRREFLIDAASVSGAERVATGHTMNDQAETILMRLVRGAGTTALAGMAPDGPPPFVRPLLGLGGGELRSWLDDRKLEYREDPSNRSLRFDRNRVRRLVVPVLEEHLNPQATRHLVKAAAAIREDSLYLDEIATDLANRATRVDRAGRVIIDIRALREVHRVLSRRVARIALERAGCDPRRVVSRHVLALLGLIEAPGGSEIHLPGRMRARKTRARITVEPR